MTTELTKPVRKLYLGIPALIFLSAYLITLSAAYRNNEQLLSFAIIGDLIITAPLAYLFIIRNTSVSKFTVLRIFILGILISGLILNTENSIVHFLKVWISPFAEAAVIFIVGRKFYISNKEAKISGRDKVDFLEHCRIVTGKVIGNRNAGDIISSEIAVFYYAFIAGKEKGIDNFNKFTSYRKNGIIPVLSIVLAIFFIEIAGMHLLLARWSNTAAVVVSILNLYTCLQLFAHIRSIKSRVISINQNTIKLHMGLAADADVDLKNIESIEFSKKLNNNPDTVKISLLNKLEGHNVVIKLKEPVEVIKIFGIKKQAKTILFYVDGPEDFLKSVNARIALNFS